MDNTQPTPVGDAPDVSMPVELRRLIGKDPRAAHGVSSTWGEPAAPVTILASIAKKILID